MGMSKNIPPKAIPRVILCNAVFKALKWIINIPLGHVLV
jgi:hypothetical protein